MDDPGTVRVVCVYDMVVATLWLKTEKDVTNYRREEGAVSGLIRITLIMNSAPSCTQHNATLRSPHLSINFLPAIQISNQVFF
jgi:hypothetical protein